MVGGAWISRKDAETAKNSETAKSIVGRVVRITELFGPPICFAIQGIYWQLATGNRQLGTCVVRSQRPPLSDEPTVPHIFVLVPHI